MVLDLFNPRQTTLCSLDNKVTLVYVDDVLIASNDKKQVEEFKVLLNQKFKLEDLGELNISWFRGG